MDDVIIGADLGGTKLLFVCGQQKLRVETGPNFAPQDFAKQLEVFIKALHARPSHIGIAVPGLVNVDGRVVVCDVLPAFAGWRPADMFDALGCRITVLNDVKAALMEEMHDAPENFTGGVVMAGTAIGAAFIAHGTPLRGTSGWAGELGYLPMPSGRQIKRLDELAGGAAIAASLGVDASTLARRAREGDPITLAAIEAAGYALSLGLAAVINLLNPSRLAIGGGTLELAGYWNAALVAARSNSIPALWHDCQVTPVRTGANVVALGAIRAASSYGMF